MGRSGQSTKQILFLLLYFQPLWIWKKPTMCFLGFRLAKGAGVGLSVHTGNDSQQLWITARRSDSGSSLPKINYLAFQWRGISRQSQLLQEIPKLSGMKGCCSQDYKYSLFLKILKFFHEMNTDSLACHVVPSHTSCLFLCPQQPLLIYPLAKPNPAAWWIYWPCMKSER